jgi:hypothetical protein
MGAYEDYLAKQGGGAAPAATPAAASPTGAFAAYLAKHGGGSGNPELDRARGRIGQGAPQPGSPFGRVSAPGMPDRPAGDVVLDTLKKPGQAYQQLLAHPRQPLDALNVLINSAPDTQIEANRSRILNALHSGWGSNPSGLVKAGTDLFFDPTTLLGGSGLIERGANALGRTAYIGAAKGMAHANPISRTAAAVHDFATPGGSAMGQLKRTLAAQQGRTGLDTYALARSAQKGAANTGADVRQSVADALAQEGRIPTKKPPAPAPPPAAAPTKLRLRPSDFDVSPTGEIKLKPRPNPDELRGRQMNTPIQRQPAPRIRPTPDLIREPSAELPPEFAAAFGPQGGFQIPGRAGEIGRAASAGAKRVTKGLTDLMFVSPQLPGLEGHGSNVLQTALLSDPGTAIGALGRFAGSGEALPFSKLREAVQKLPGVRGLKTAQDASVARATESGANTVHPEDFGSGGWTAKIPGVGMAARESNRGLQAWDSAVKGALNDKWTRHFEAQGYSPRMAAAKAADRVAQDVVDYSDKSDLTRFLQHGLPFATYASKKPGIIARAIIRHPERVLAMTRDNPNFDSGRDEPMTYPDQGRPLASIFNAANNRSPSTKGKTPYPGAQYQRASSGAALNDLLGLLNPYFTYGPPAKHAGGDALAGWLKLLLSQTAGNVPGGEAVLNKTGLNYFGQ